MRSSPDGHGRLAADGSSVFIGFPDGTPMIYTSTSRQATGAKGLRKVVLDVRTLTLLFLDTCSQANRLQQAIPKAISRPHSRYALSPTSLSTRTLHALLFLRGPGRGNAAAGGWGIFIEGSVECNPLDFLAFKRINTERPEEIYEDENGDAHGAGEAFDDRFSKRRKLVAKGRFGNSGIESDSKGIELLHIRMEDPFIGVPGSHSLAINIDDIVEGIPEGEESEYENEQEKDRPPLRWDSLFASDAENQDLSMHQDWRPDVRLTFHGTHIFAGVRHLTDMGVIDGEKMPGWMTGEAGVSTGAVRNGVIRGHKGSGV
jgi:central kinetochore subunit Mis15/CHL4